MLLFSEGTLTEYNDWNGSNNIVVYAQALLRGEALDLDAHHGTPTAAHAHGTVN